MYQNQNFQEPFVAIVIDPVRTVSDGKVCLGACRTYPRRCLVHLAVKNFTRQIDLLDCSDDLQEDLSRNDMVDDIGIAKHDIDLHNKMRKKIIKTPVKRVLKNEKWWWC
ncbi:hypothetical protein HCN44_008840 [Aphidius gifuensis]|uniref:Uncharacterized protein n=1 Tax=Aphidius gifuensis TaxID=684658 RepID=A0A835CVP0_APHGI|nr:hypothetical protein HCN44_008840 [Aphidius gifuensis]